MRCKRAISSAVLSDFMLFIPFWIYVKQKVISTPFVVYHLRFRLRHIVEPRMRNAALVEAFVNHGHRLKMIGFLSWRFGRSHVGNIHITKGDNPTNQKANDKTHKIFDILL